MRFLITFAVVSTRAGFRTYVSSNTTAGDSSWDSDAPAEMDLASEEPWDHEDPFKGCGYSATKFAPQCYDIAYLQVLPDG